MSIIEAPQRKAVIVGFPYDSAQLYGVNKDSLLKSLIVERDWFTDLYIGIVVYETTPDLDEEQNIAAASVDLQAIIKASNDVFNTIYDITGINIKTDVHFESAFVVE